ncbi:MAG TPA: hypothetical protein VNZ52_12490 [Candidatus Thermoplasmatota archaeon]|nr:hypothetical protein [Candidatus Thermoplasmatota archaeon]
MDKQVLFRLDENLLMRLDRALGTQGYKTRNAWFKEMVESYLQKAESGAGAQPPRAPAKS